MSDGGGYSEASAGVPMVRVSVTASPDEEAEETLLARMASMFPGGLEEVRAPDGRLEVAAYTSPPLTLPDGLGPWRVEPVEAGWERRWREFHHGGAVADRLWVGPPWETPDPGLIPVVIDPGLAFGTGAHATTTGCLELLCSLEERSPVLDLGCGSGVLSIAAAKLGFGPVYACDVDPLAVTATRQNAVANDVEVEVWQADALTDPMPDVPLWFANILRGPLLDILARPDLPPRLIVSGMLETEQFDPPRAREVRRVARAGWKAVLLDRV